jgi:carbamoyltransferase
MNILGIQKDHNSSACLFKGRELIYYNQEERLSRIKKDGGIPILCLGEIKEIASEIDVLLISGYDVTHTDRMTIQSLLKKLGFTFSKRYTYEAYHKHHHLTHAATAFYNSGFKEALIVVSDGKGSTYILNNGRQANETTSIFKMTMPDNVYLLYKRFYTKCQHPQTLTPIMDESFGLLHSHKPPKWLTATSELEVRNDFDRGFMYEAVSRAVGFKDEGGKMMGLQSYGVEVEDPRLLPKVFDDNFKLQTFEIFIVDAFDRGYSLNTMKYPHLNTHEYMVNFTYKIQKEFERSGLHLINKWLEESGCKNLILTGGTALNVVANAYFRENLPADVSLYVDPMCGDEGNIIGLCQYYIRGKTVFRDVKTFPNIYLCGNDPIYYFELQENEVVKDDVSYSDIIDLIVNGNIVALFQGKAESGPRALGNRTILFDPRVQNGKDIVNRVKGREYFRPFAASVMLEHANEWFDMLGMEESPYMMYALQAREGVADKIPSVVHVDNTCRIQTVSQEQNFHYYNLIKEFYNRTEVPLLFNTSFNLADDPIVHTVYDAIESLRKSKIEYLYLPEVGQLIYIKND